MAISMFIEVLEKDNERQKMSNRQLKVKCERLWQKIHLKIDKIFIKQSISIFLQLSFSDLVKFGPIFGILEKTLESSLYCKGIKRVNPKGNQP